MHLGERYSVTDTRVIGRSTTRFAEALVARIRFCMVYHATIDIRQPKMYLCRWSSPPFLGGTTAVLGNRSQTQKHNLAKQGSAGSPTITPGGVAR